MPSHSKTFGPAFVVDDDKLTVLVDKIKQKFEGQKQEYTARFVVITADGSAHEYDSLALILGTSDPITHPINRLSISFKARRQENNVTPHEVEVDFIEESRDGDGVIEVAVKNEDPHWTLETLLVIQKQVERILQNNYRKKIPLGIASLCVFSLLLVLAFSPQVYTKTPDVKSFWHADTMWLTPEDIVMIEKEYSSTSTTNDKYSKEVLLRQVNNIKAYQKEIKERPPKMNGKAFYTNGKLMLIFFLLFCCMAGFVVWIRSSPPPAVFAFGTMAGWYQNQVGQRNRVLYTVLALLVICCLLYFK